jgi:hypothetical protein
LNSTPPVAKLAVEVIHEPVLHKAELRNSLSIKETPYIPVSDVEKTNLGNTQFAVFVAEVVPKVEICNQLSEKETEWSTKVKYCDLSPVGKRLDSQVLKTYETNLGNTQFAVFVAEVVPKVEICNQKSDNETQTEMTSKVKAWDQMPADKIHPDHPHAKIHTTQHSCFKSLAPNQESDRPNPIQNIIPIFYASLDLNESLDNTPSGKSPTANWQENMPSSQPNHSRSRLPRLIAPQTSFLPQRSPQVGLLKMTVPQSRLPRLITSQTNLSHLNSLISKLPKLKDPGTSFLPKRSPQSGHQQKTAHRSHLPRPIASQAKLPSLSTTQSKLPRPIKSQISLPATNSQKTWLLGQNKPLSWIPRPRCTHLKIKNPLASPLDVAHIFMLTKKQQAMVTYRDQLSKSAIILPVTEIPTANLSVSLQETGRVYFGTPEEFVRTTIEPNSNFLQSSIVFQDSERKWPPAAAPEPADNNPNHHDKLYYVNDLPARLLTPCPSKSSPCYHSIFPSPGPLSPSPSSYNRQPCICNKQSNRSRPPRSRHKQSSSYSRLHCYCCRLPSLQLQQFFTAARALAIALAVSAATAVP